MEDPSNPGSNLDSPQKAIWQVWMQGKLMGQQIWDATKDQGGPCPVNQKRQVNGSCAMTAGPPPDSAPTTATASTTSTYSPPPGPSCTGTCNQLCTASTFVNQGSGASPLVTDCQQILKNIAGGGMWEVENVVQAQHQIVQYGSCKFGVQGGQPYNTVGDASDVGFHVGNQDIFYIINTAISMFATLDGRIGAKGVFPCQGDQSNYPDTYVSWGLY